MSIFHKIVLRTMRENRARTVITIVGIILSLSMFTAVTVSVSSLQHYMMDSAILRQGSWHGRMNVSEEGRQDILQGGAPIEKATFLELLGYARVEGITNPDKPYLCLKGMDENAASMLPIHITKGRMPENSRELLLPEHLSYNGGVSYELNDVLTLSVGKRVTVDAEGETYVLNQQTPYLYTAQEQAEGMDNSATETEELTGITEQAYTVTGFYERPSFENYSAPGYTALTCATKDAGADNASSAGSSGSNSASSADGSSGSGDASDTDGSSGSDSVMYDAFLEFTNPRQADSWLRQHAPDWYETNRELLRSLGIGDSAYQTVVYGLAAILTAIILFGSVALIYNAFAISVTERTRQFGLLASIGATRRQLIHSVLFEAFFLCLLGIPLGLLSGIAGIGVTFHFLGGSLSSFIDGDNSAPLRLYVSPTPLIVAALIGLATVLISAFIPILRNTRLSPIEAIRMSADVSIRARKVRTSRLTYLLFGLPGTLALKNFKRSKKKYRAAVFSLFVSLVLFISASSFTRYLTDAASNVIEDAGADISYHASLATWEDLAEKLRLTEQFDDLSSIDLASATITNYATLYLDPETLSSEYQDVSHLWGGELTLPDGRIRKDVQLCFVDDASYREYLRQEGFSEEGFFDPSRPLALALDLVRTYNEETSKYVAVHLFQRKAGEICPSLENIAVPEGYDVAYDTPDDSGVLRYAFRNLETGEYDELDMESCVSATPLPIGGFADEPPYFLADAYGSYPALLFPESCRKAVLSETKFNLGYTSLRFAFTVNDHTKAMADLSQILEDNDMYGQGLYDHMAAEAASRSMVLVITVFSYGFIVLISLIAAANVFHTISTGILLRRRDFAMLRSVGMEQRGFWRMMCFECLLYGFKGLLYGLPVSLFLSWQIFRQLGTSWEMGFYLPWKSYLMAIFSVFAVVASAMAYSMRKIRKENIMEALKEE